MTAETLALVQPGLARLPPEILSQILSFLPASSLAACCTVNKDMLELSLPLLYTHMECLQLSGCLATLRSLAKSRNRPSFIGRYSHSIQSISIPKRPATHEVKAAIAASLAENITLGHFPNLRLLDWPFGYIRRGFLEDDNAAVFDEPLWEALLHGCPKLQRIIIGSTAYQHPKSALWLLADKCCVILQTASWQLRVNSLQRLEPL